MSSLWKTGLNLKNFNTKALNNYKNIYQNFKKLTSTANSSVSAATTAASQTVVSSSRSINKKIGIWLGGCTALVAGAVVLGGVTRLTESGLSMVDWQLIKDMVPPKNEQEWIEEFERYKEYPEWKYLNKDREFTLKDFKFIFYMEWSHRMWGRMTGLAFFLPAAYFWKKGYFNSAMKKRAGFFGALLGFQGFLGWYMVKSGLNEPEKQTDIPRVSQYRLASHLGSAFLLYSGFLWTSLSHLFQDQKGVQPINSGTLRSITMRSHNLMALIFTTALAGAFVAGLDAGLVYNSFPKMGDRWIPSDVMAFEPKWKNFFENPTMVQFQHRILGISTVSAICLYALSMRGVVLPPRARLALQSLVAMSFVQVSLGISTLLLYVPTNLAALHQSGSLALLSFAIWLATELKRIPKI
jgi:cytochrome c oxidase assembly protein subunit 15